MNENRTYDPATDAVLLDLIQNTVADVNVALARELNFTLKNGEVHASALSLFTDKSIDAACDAVLGDE